jgi:hypothetical protein
VESKELIPYLVNIPGGLIMAIALYGFFTGKITTKDAANAREMIWKTLYEQEREDGKKIELLNDGLIKDLATQNQSHLETVRLLERFVPTTTEVERRRRDNA